MRESTKDVAKAAGKRAFGIALGCGYVFYSVGYVCILVLLYVASG